MSDKKEYMKEWRKSRKESSLCKACKNKSEFGRYCKWHKIRDFANSATTLHKDCRKKFGRRPLISHSVEIAIQKRDYSNNKITKGICRYCSKPRVTNTQCFWHYIKRFAYAATVYRKEVSRNNYTMALKGEALNTLTNQLIDKLEASNWRCYYTGIKLEIGNLSLDHVLNSADNPELLTDINNLQWTTKEINNLKNSHSPKDFYNFMMQLKEGIAYLEQNEDFKKYLTE